MTATPSPTPRPKRAWPLFLLALTGLIPVFGFFTGAAALSWGLVSSRPHALRAAVVGGLGALLNLVGVVVLGVQMQRTPTYAAAQAVVTQQDLARVATELDRYRARTGDYPPTLQALLGGPIPLRLLNINDQSAGPFHVPRPYQYRVAPDGRSFDLFAVGPDGRPHTADDVRPRLPDSLRAHSGYRPQP
jgi:Type II secretion system (T2SS), protein G